MDEMKMENTIRETLHSCADSLEAPETLKTRVKFAVNSSAPAPKRRLGNWKKRVIALGAVAAIAITGAFAGGEGMIRGWGWSNQRMDHDETMSHISAISDSFQLPEAFGDGFLFQYGYDVENEGEYEGKTEHRDEVVAKFVKDGVDLELSVQQDFTIFEDADSKAAGETQTGAAGDIVLTYNSVPYMFVPPDYEPTEEEKLAEANGELVISYGTEEIEHKQFQSVSWMQGDIVYKLYGFNTGLDAQTMFDMAAEIIGA
jgi:hypothetical protein